MRSLLEGVLERSANQFEHAISRTLDELEQELFKLAERSRSNEQQHARFEALREIKRGRADIAPRFLLHVESSLAHLDARPARRPSARSARSPEHAARAGRLGRARGRSRAAGDRQQVRNPPQPGAVRARASLRRARRQPRVGARRAAARARAADRALRHATRWLDLGVEYRVLAYRMFDRVAMLPIGEFYEVINGYLAKQRILAHLQSPAVRARDGTAAARRQPRGAAHGRRARAATDAPTGQARNAAPRTAPDQQDSELFSTLRMLLSGRRHTQGAASMPFVENGYMVSRDDLQMRARLAADSSPI